MEIEVDNKAQKKKHIRIHKAMTTIYCDEKQFGRCVLQV